MLGLISSGVKYGAIGSYLGYKAYNSLGAVGLVSSVVKDAFSAIQIPLMMWNSASDAESNHATCLKDLEATKLVDKSRFLYQNGLDFVFNTKNAAQENLVCPIYKMGSVGFTVGAVALGLFELYTAYKMCKTSSGIYQAGVDVKNAVKGSVSYITSFEFLKKQEKKQEPISVTTNDMETFLNLFMDLSEVLPLSIQKIFSHDHSMIVRFETKEPLEEAITTLQANGFVVSTVYQTEAGDITMIRLESTDNIILQIAQSK